MHAVDADPPFPLPRLHGEPDAEGWIEEVAHYRVSPREKPKFQSILPTATLFAKGSGYAKIRMRSRPTALDGDRAYEVIGEQRLGHIVVDEHLTCIHRRGGIVAERLERTIGTARHETVQFDGGPFPWPHATYPEVLLPFLMRGVPLDGERRALYSWTNDRFVARVYIEARGGKKPIQLPAGRIDAIECWMYPDLNDWVSLGQVLTRLAKPLLPRYDIFFEAAPPHRVVRYEGPYGPPGAIEVLLELDR
ncbi:MAG: hypothetical protein AB7S26_26370 [Sandaracinaceae bacterium]